MGRKGNKDRVVPFPMAFREILAVHVEKMTQQGATFLYVALRRTVATFTRTWAWEGSIYWPYSFNKPLAKCKPVNGLYALTSPFTGLLAFNVAIGFEPMRDIGFT